MSMTISEKILAKSSGNEKVEAGEIGLPMENSKLILPCGIYGRWES